MAALKTLFQGDSLSIGFTFGTYDTSRIEHSYVYLNEVAFTTTLDAGVLRCAIPSSSTKQFCGNVPVLLVIDDSVFGVRKTAIGNIYFQSTGTFSDSSVNTGYNIEVAVIIEEDSTAISVTLLEAFRGYSSYDIYVKYTTDVPVLTEEEWNIAYNDLVSYEQSALASKNAAKISEDNSKSSETAAEGFKNTASTKATEAYDSAGAASISEQHSKTSEDNAKASELASEGFKNTANNQAEIATNKASEANTSAINAHDSELAAKTSEDNAKASELASSGFAIEAEGYKDTVLANTTLLGGIAYNAAAPTPAKSGYYDFISAGTKPAWLTGSVTSVAIGDRVIVVYANSAYTYTYQANPNTNIVQELGTGTNVVVSQNVSTINYAKAIEPIAHDAAAPSPIIPTGTTKTYEFSSGGICAWLANQIVEKGDKVTVALTAPSTYVRTYQDVVKRKVDDSNIVQTTGNSTTNIMSQNAVSVLIADGYVFGGYATVSETPSTPLRRTFKIASMAGTYAGYGNLKVYSNEIGIFIYVNSAWSKIGNSKSILTGISTNALFSTAVKEIYLSDLDYTQITEAKCMYCGVSGSNFYNALYVTIAGVTQQVFQETYSTILACRAAGSGIRKYASGDRYALIDYSELPEGVMQTISGIVFTHPLTLDFSPSINQYIKNAQNAVIVGTSNISDSENFNKSVLELMLGDLDTSTITKFTINYGAVTGSNFYNSFFVYTSSGTLNIFMDVYSTQAECAANAKGIKWNYSLGKGVQIDFTKLAYGTYYFTSLTLKRPVTIDYCPNLSTFHNRVDIWKNHAWNRLLFDTAICIGDSLTEGNIYDYPYHVGVVSALSYPTQLSKLGGWTITNAGESGITSINWWANKFANYTYSSYNLAFICLGANGGLTDTLATDVDPYEDYNNYANTNTGCYCKIIKGALAQNPKLVIVLVIDSIQSGNVTRTVIQKIGAKYGLPVIDLTDKKYFNLQETRYHGYKNASDQTNNIKDMLHFNAIGYAAMAHCIFSAFTNYCFDNPDVINSMRMY
jgi:lysophospholipase L1-like esterase